MKIFLDANICLDLLDSKRTTSQHAIAWYNRYKDDQSKEFYFSGDFITTIYYILTQKRKINSKLVLNAIDKLCDDITPLFIQYDDFIGAKNDFLNSTFEDFEDLIILNSAERIMCKQFITNDKKLLKLKNYQNIKITSILSDIS